MVLKWSRNCVLVLRNEREGETDKRRIFEIECYELGKIRNQFKCSIYILVCGDTKINGTVSILREQSSQDRPGKRAVGTNQRAGKKDVVKACPLMPADH